MENEETSTHFDAMAFVDKAECCFVPYGIIYTYGGMKECVVRLLLTVDIYLFIPYALIVYFCECVCETMPKNEQTLMVPDDSKDDGENDDNGVMGYYVKYNIICIICEKMYDFFHSLSLSLSAYYIYEYTIFKRSLSFCLSTMISSLFHKHGL